MHLKVAWNSILAPKSLFTYDVTISYLKAWYTLLTTKNWFFGKGNYFICITVIFQLIATDNFHFGTPVKCPRHSKYFHLCAYFGIQLIITFFSNDRFSLNFQAMLSIYRYIYKHLEKGSMTCFLKSYWPISHPYPQYDFAVVMDQRLPDENPWDLNCHI